MSYGQGSAAGVGLVGSKPGKLPMSMSRWSTVTCPSLGGDDDNDDMKVGIADVARNGHNSTDRARVCRVAVVKLDHHVRNEAQNIDHRSDCSWAQPSDALAVWSRGVEAGKAVFSAIGSDMNSSNSESYDEGTSAPLEGDEEVVAKYSVS